MSTILEIKVEEILPSAAAILAQQGVPDHASGMAKLLAVAEDARAELAAALSPAGVLEKVDPGEFADIYRGQGFNEPDTPLQKIFPRAEELSLFAVTCGQAVCDRISDLFQANDYPLGATLDAGASLAADRAAQVAQDKFTTALAAGSGVLRYSPGYCGWHVSSQQNLFARLGSRNAGISLSESSLMWPLKSVSGVIVAGPPEIHRFAIDYPFCAACTGKECRERIRTVLAPFEEEI
ncbi:MAG: vitamin B12 dependent-methionine synthase activation domain-containing protein [Candidatus Krumholzibacteriota bacterium]